MTSALSQLRSSDELGPVSRHMEAELRELAREQGIVLWLDKEGVYRELAESLRTRAAAGKFPFPVHAFRGSFLELMLELDGHEDGVGMTPLVVHVPGHNEDDMRGTPLLELYRAGRRHRRALPTLIKDAAHGLATVEQLDALLAAPGLTLDKADAWLAGLATPHQGTGPDLSGMGAEALFDELMQDGALAKQLGQPEVLQAVARRAKLVLGITHEFQERMEASGALRVQQAASAQSQASYQALVMAAWALYVEFVHDLRRAPKDDWLLPLGHLPKPAVKACQSFAKHFRDRYATNYTTMADEIEQQLLQELRDATAEDLGNVDTFRFEDRKLLAAALEGLARADYYTVYDWAIQRGESFWAREDIHRKRAWQLVLGAAALGQALVEDADLLVKVRSLEDAVERYAGRGFRVDLAQRRLEQARQQASVLEIPEFAELRARLDAMRVDYRAWADQQANDFNSLCTAQGFLPPPGLRQRELFEDVVRPWAQQDGVTAYFTVDALRFEMAQQLSISLQGAGSGGHVELKARLAELPTVTEVGMNVLAPLSLGGKLRLDLDKGDIRGFRSHEARVATPEDRRKVMHERVGGKTCPKLSLEEVINRDVTSLRRAIAEARLVLVHSEGIDKAGEKGVGLAVFERELRNLRAAWRQLYDAGVRRFVFTADHGFLLHDSVTRGARAHGFKTDPKRRHVISSDYLDRDGKVAVRASDLGYECEDVSFLFPADAAPFDLGERAKDFVHGGNSLQERVIPVLTIQHRHAAGSDALRYELEVEVQKPVARMNCLRVTLRLEKNTTLSFSSPSMVELALECIDDPNVQVELCDARDARVVGSVVEATVQQRFELFFRLRGISDQRLRVRIRHATSMVTVTPVETAVRFEVEPSSGIFAPVTVAPPKKQSAVQHAWLLELPEGGVRDVFQHLAVHGTINEAEATRMLGGPRQFRAFSAQLEKLAAVAPFRVRVDVSSGSKCYVRTEG